MDPLQKDKIVRILRMTESERLSQALHLMAVGIQLKRDAIRNRHSDETDEQIEKRLRHWLIREYDQ